MAYFEVMTMVTLLQCDDDPTAVASSAFLAGLVIAQNDPELANAIRHTMEQRIAEEQGTTAEQVEVAIKQAFS